MNSQRGTVIRYPVFIGSLVYRGKKSENAFDCVSIFQKEFDDIEESLETFRAKIYFRSKVESIERIPVTGRMMNFKDSTEISNS